MKFEAGKTYKTRLVSDCEQNAILTVISRTEKTIKASTEFGVKTLRISLWNGVEQVKPWGSYSMAPIISANKAA